MRSSALDEQIEKRPGSATRRPTLLTQVPGVGTLTARASSSPLKTQPAFPKARARRLLCGSAAPPGYLGLSFALSCGSPKPATITCAGCLVHRRSLHPRPLRPGLRSQALGTVFTLRKAARAARNGRWWPWLANSRCCSCGSGRPVKSMSPCATRSGGRRLLPASGQDGPTNAGRPDSGSHSR